MASVFEAVVVASVRPQSDDYYHLIVMSVIKHISIELITLTSSLVLIDFIDLSPLSCFIISQTVAMCVVPVTLVINQLGAVCIVCVCVCV